MRIILTLVALALTSIACGDDDGSGPSTPADLNGMWTYEADVAGGGFSCSFEGIQASITQSGSTFSGTTAGGSATCAAFGLTQTLEFGAQTLAQGSIDGVDLEFVIQSDLTATHDGTVGGDTMSGSVTMTGTVDELPGVQLALTGTWTANR